MSAIQLNNFNTLFPGLFTVYFTVEVQGDDSVYDVYWMCDTCNERAVMELTEGVVQEYTLSCSCRSGYSFGVDIWEEIEAAAENYIIAHAGISADEIIEDDTEAEATSIWQKVKRYLTGLVR